MQESDTPIGPECSGGEDGLPASSARGEWHARDATLPEAIEAWTWRAAKLELENAALRKAADANASALRDVCIVLGVDTGGDVVDVATEAAAAARELDLAKITLAALGQPDEALPVAVRRLAKDAHDASDAMVEAMRQRDEARQELDAFRASTDEERARRHEHHHARIEALIRERNEARAERDDAQMRFAAADAWTPFSRRDALHAEQRDGESGADTVRRLIRERNEALADAKSARAMINTIGNRLGCQPGDAVEALDGLFEAAEQRGYNRAFESVNSLLDGDFGGEVATSEAQRTLVRVGTMMNDARVGRLRSVTLDRVRAALDCPDGADIEDYAGQVRRDRDAAVHEAKHVRARVETANRSTERTYNSVINALHHATEGRRVRTGHAGLDLALARVTPLADAARWMARVKELEARLARIRAAADGAESVNG